MGLDAPAAYGRNRGQTINEHNSSAMARAELLQMNDIGIKSFSAQKTEKGF